MATPRPPHLWTLVAVGLAALTGCEPSGSALDGGGTTRARHPWFPISPGATHAFDCASCHPPERDSFKDFTCVTCHAHEQPLTDRLHEKAAGYEYTSSACWRCHPDGTGTFEHAGTTDGCAACHAEGAPFAALPTPHFDHPPIRFDCSGCHTPTSWRNASEAPTRAWDPSQVVEVVAQMPFYAQTSIIALATLRQQLPMTMNHASPQLPAGAMSACSNCHERAAAGSYEGARLHVSLEKLQLPQPTACASCHGNSAPQGFVGPVARAPARTPSSAEMKHDAVAWDGGEPTTRTLVSTECGTCHRPPTGAAPATWASGASDGGARYHVPLLPADFAQPTSCLDCHANTRPTSTLTADGGSMPAGVSFEHGNLRALGDCAPCHAGAPSAWTSWSSGQFHQTTGDAQPTCLPCHEGERPTSTARWTNATYRNAPFDYTGSLRSGHGAFDDCAICHPSGSDGAVTWARGHSAHDQGTATRTCLPCHTSQRPTQVVSNFNHATQGSGDCFGCHSESIRRGSFTKYPDDWRGGQQYPGSVLVAAPGQFVTVNTITLARDATRRVTGMTSSAATLNNGMKHDALAVPEVLNAGAAADYSKDQGKCWHCHTNTAGNVTDFTNGLLHASFTTFRSTPGGPTRSLTQPTKCLECHSEMSPPHLVELGNSALVPMDHTASFTAPAPIGGQTVTSVAALDCAVCHARAGERWADGRFHAVIGAATPADCVGCHYPLMADATQADVTASTRYTMRHRSTLLATQACQTCHPNALGQSTQGTNAARWSGGLLHPVSTPQPASCTECHAVTVPASLTQSAVAYTLPQGGTATNGRQWMSHAAPAVAGKDCALCHAGDAKASGSAWSTSAPFHASLATVTTCNECHGGTPAGSNNNLPAGLTDTATVTTSSAAPANTRDQISHADINVTKYQCNFCHRQVGPSTATGVKGREWAQASFHKNFTTNTPLVLNGTTGRCSNCHLGLKPGATYTAFDHKPYSGTSTQDCSACHTWPGTSTTTPNWKGAAGAHATSGPTKGSSLACVSCHGQTGTAAEHLSIPEASHRGGVSNGNLCTSCHIDFTDFTGATSNLLYAHSNSKANANGCVTCHAFTGQSYTTLTTTPKLNHPSTTGGRSFSQTLTVSGQFGRRTFNDAHTSSKMSNCGACHAYSGSTTSTTDIWAFVHNPYNPGISNSKRSSGCNECH